MNEASQWIAVWAAGLFSGAALYVSLVEHPARMQCGTVLAVTEFGPSYKRAALMQSILALLGSMGALVAWLAGDGPFWAVGGLLLLFSVPFTLIVIMPTNRRPPRSRARPLVPGSRSPLDALGPSSLGADGGEPGLLRRLRSRAAGGALGIDTGVVSRQGRVSRGRWPERLQELHDPLGGPEAPGGRGGGHEPDVAAGGQDLALDEAGGRQRPADDRVHGDHGVGGGPEEQGGPVEPQQVRARAGALVIVGRVAEAAVAGGDRVVVLADRPHSLLEARLVDVGQPGLPAAIRALEVADVVPLVYAVAAPAERVRARREVHRRGASSGGAAATSSRGGSGDGRRPGTGRDGTRSHPQHDLPEVLGRFQHLVGPPRLRERQRGVHDAAQPAREEQGGRVEQVGLASHVGPEDRELPGEEMTQLGRPLRARSGPAGDEAAPVSEAEDGTLPGRL